MIAGSGTHALAEAVDVVALVAVKHAQHGHQLAGADNEYAVGSLDAFGFLEVLRALQSLLDAFGVDLPHGLAHDLEAQLGELGNDTLWGDKPCAIGIVDGYLDTLTQFVCCFATRPENAPHEQPCEDK